MARSYDQIFAATAPKSIVANTPASRENFVPATAWVNLGIYVNVTNSEGVVESKKVMLPRGIALDTMPRMAGNSDVANRSNELMDALVELANTMEAGGYLNLKLFAEIHRVGVKAEVPEAQKLFQASDLA